MRSLHVELGDSLSIDRDLRNSVSLSHHLVDALPAGSLPAPAQHRALDEDTIPTWRQTAPHLMLCCKRIRLIDTLTNAVRVGAKLAERQWQLVPLSLLFQREDLDWFQHDWRLRWNDIAEVRLNGGRRDAVMRCQAQEGCRRPVARCPAAV